MDSLCTTEYGVHHKEYTSLKWLVVDVIVGVSYGNGYRFTLVALFQGLCIGKYQVADSSQLHGSRARGNRLLKINNVPQVAVHPVIG